MGWYRARIAAYCELRPLVVLSPARELRPHEAGWRRRLDLRVRVRVRVRARVRIRVRVKG